MGESLRRVVDSLGNMAGKAGTMPSTTGATLMRKLRGLRRIGDWQGKDPKLGNLGNFKGVREGGFRKQSS